MVAERVTVTEVHLETGACQPRHTHETSEQIWYATQGCGKLLLAENKEKEFCAGDVVRFADKDGKTYKEWCKYEQSISSSRYAK